MELVLSIIFLGILLRGARLLGVWFGRAGPAGLFVGLVGGSAQLGWPIGVQEEDRDRPWGTLGAAGSPGEPEVAAEPEVEAAGSIEDLPDPGPTTVGLSRVRRSAGGLR